MQNVNYTEKLKRRFADNGGRLFFVDGSKARAFTSIGEIIASENPASLLCIVKDTMEAKQAKCVLGEKAELITSVAAFNGMLSEVASTDAEKVYLYAKDFKEKHPCVIITLSDGDNFVLHHELCKTKGKAGVYNEGAAAAYCISDFLRDGEYNMLVVDNVYSMFDFKIPKDEDLKFITPQTHDRIDLMGQTYYTDIRHSYKKLWRLVDNAQKALVFSQVIVDRDAISLYAGLSLVHNNFSYKEALAFATSHSFDMNSEIERVSGNTSYCTTSGDLLSLCLQQSKGSRQIISEDLESLGAYFAGNLNFMTQEELFLRILYTQAKRKFSLNVSSNDTVIRTLENDMDITAAVCGVFFSDDIKGDIESNLKTAKMAMMSQEDVSSLVGTFGKYAEICEFAPIGENTKVLRIYHDDSAFEDLIRRTSPSFDRDEESFSASYRGDDMLYKCVATKNLIDSGKIKLPVMLVSCDPGDEICRQLKRITEIEVTPYQVGSTEISANAITVLGYEHLETLTLRLGINSVVFFDVIPDINRLDSCVKSALWQGSDVNAVVLATYDNISGKLIDIWQESWFSSQNNILPIRNTEVYIKGDDALDYSNVINEIDSIYEAYKSLIEGTYTSATSELASKFSEAISRFTLGVSTPTAIIEADFGYFKDIAGFYANIFANSVSISTKGREVIKEARQKGKVLRKRGTREVRTKYAIESENNVVIFNLCARQLHETCDYKNVDCASCEYYKRHYVNDFEMFKEGTRRFFKDTIRIIKRIEDEKRKASLDVTISGSQQLETEDVIPAIKEAGKGACEIIDKMSAAKTEPGSIMYVNFSDVFDIKEAVQSVYINFFVKYYDQIMKIFTKATNKMKTAFETAGQGIGQHSDTV